MLTASGDAGWAFGEDQGRYLVTAGDAAAVLAAAAKAGVPAVQIGTTGGDAVALGGTALALAGLRAAHEGALPELLAGEA